MQKQDVFNIKGMQRDFIDTNKNQEFAYEIVNMTIIPDEKTNSFTLVNEKGAKLCEEIQLNGSILGQCATPNCLIVFTVDTTNEKNVNPDYIYKIWKGEGDDINEDDYSEIKWRYKPLYNGNLGFSLDHPIDTLYNYETETIQKVYWIDGVHVLRHINIISGTYEDNLNYQFDSILPSTFKFEVKVERDKNGYIPNGTAQYYILYTLNGTESEIIYISHLIYFTEQELKQGLKFSILNVSFKWDTIALYRCFWTSPDSTPDMVKCDEIRKSDVSDGALILTDDGRGNAEVFTDLFFKEKIPFVFDHMTTKNNTLFAGNIRLSSESSSIKDKAETVAKIIKENNILNTGSLRTIALKEVDELPNITPITHYKYGEKYRFGIRLASNNGMWSDPIWVGDAFITVSPSYTKRPTPELDLHTHIDYEDFSGPFYKYLLQSNISKIMPVCVFPTEQERKVIMQGVVCPTVYNLRDRKENGPYAQASWFMRPNGPRDLWGIRLSPGKKGTIKVQDNQNENTIHEYLTYGHHSDIAAPSNVHAGYFGIYRSGEGDLDYAIYLDDSARSYNGDYITYTYDEDSETYKPARSTYGDPTQGTWLEFRHNYALRTKGWSYGAPSSLRQGKNVSLEFGQPFGFGVSDINGKEADGNNNIWGNHRCAEIGNNRYHVTLPVNRVYHKDGEYYRIYGNSDKIAHVSVDKDYNTGSSAYYVDCSIVTLNSPELEYDKTSNINLSGTSFRIVGFAPITSTNSNMLLEVENKAANPSNKKVGLRAYTSNNAYPHGFKGVVSSNYYYSSANGSAENYYYTLLNPWHTTGSIQVYIEGSHDKNMLKRKVLSNLRAAGHTIYFNTVDFHIDGPQSAYMSLEDDAFSKCVGWKPSKCFTYLYNPTDIFATIKFRRSSGGTESWVYKGSVKDTMAFSSYNYEQGQITTYTSSSISDPFGDSDATSTPHSWKLGGVTNRGASINYASSPHALIAFDDTYIENVGRCQTILPTFANCNTIGVPDIGDIKSDSELGCLYGDPNTISIPNQARIYLHYNKDIHSGWGNTEYYALNYDYEELLDEPKQVLHNEGYVWIGELYRNDDPDFGGTNEYALVNNVWNIGGSSVSLYDDEGFKYTHALGEKRIEYSYKAPYGNNWVPHTNAEYTNYITTIQIGYGKKAADLTQGIFIKYDDAPQYLPDDIPISQVSVKMSIQKDSELYNQILNFMVEQWNSNDSDEVKFAYKSIDLNSETQNLLNDLIDDSYIKVGLKTTSSGILDLDVLNNENVSNLKITIGNRSLKYDTTKYWFDDPTLFCVSLSFTYGWDYMITIPICKKSELNMPPLPDNVVRWDSGDTYYQRFETLKTYPVSDQVQNSIIDITSFYVETRLNLHGRTDSNKGNLKNFNLNTSNFNVGNEAYNQKNNLFSYSIINSTDYLFPTKLIWSLPKVAGETVDAWINSLLLSNSIDVNSAKGPITALTKSNDDIIIFQANNISKLLYNSRVEVQTSDEVPIQLASSNMVEGIVNISEFTGVSDKDALVSTSNNLYWVDANNKAIYRYSNNKIEEISTSKGFLEWSKDNIESNSKIITYYDKSNREVLFYSPNFKNIHNLNVNWLGFSELTDSFSSFYTYPKMILESYKDIPILLHNNRIYFRNKGSYNYLIPEDAGNPIYSPYGITVVSNKNFNSLKSFNVVEFNSDSYVDDELKPKIIPFDTITVKTNTEKEVKQKMEFNPYMPSTLKRKFKSWKVNIPRIKEKGVSKRIMDYWAKIGLWKNTPEMEKTELRNLTVYYSE